MKLPKVKSDSNDFYWILFKPIREWKEGNPYPELWPCGFAWDWCSNDDIKNALLTNIERQDLNKDWQDCIKETDRETEEDFKKFHIERIALLAQLILEGNEIELIGMELMSIEYDIISDGNHRIRALEYLGYDAFPAWISGYCHIIEEAVEKGFTIKNKF
jgi:hypothetical protein